MTNQFNQKRKNKDKAIDWFYGKITIERVADRD